MDPRLNSPPPIAPTLRAELSTLLSETEKLAKSQTPGQILDLRGKIQQLMRNEDFKKNFDSLQPTMRRLTKSLSKLERNWSETQTATSTADWKKLTREIGSVLRGALDTRLVPSDAVVKEFEEAVQTNNHTKLEQLLRRYKIDVNAESNFDSACSLCDARTVALLVSFGGNVQDPALLESLLYSITDNTRPIEETRKVYKVLVDAGFNPNEPMEGKGGYQLQKFVKESAGPLTPETLQEFIDQVGLQVNPQRESEGSPYVPSFIFHDQSPDLVRVLLFNGALINEDTAKEMRVDPRFSEMMTVRDRAESQMNELLITWRKGAAEALTESEGLKKSLVPSDLFGVVTDYSNETMFTISRSPELRAAFLMLCNQIQAEIRGQ